MAVAWEEYSFYFASFELTERNRSSPGFSCCVFNINPKHVCSSRCYESISLILRKKGPNAVIMFSELDLLKATRNTMVSDILDYVIRLLFPWTYPEKCTNMFLLLEVHFHFIKYNCKKKENPQSCFCLPNIRNQSNIHICFLRHAFHNSAFRLLSLHSTKFEWCALSTQLIARYQPNVRIVGRYLAHRISTNPRTEITLF